MKQLEINFGKATILASGLPKGAKVLWLRKSILTIEFVREKEVMPHQKNIHLPYNGMGVLGFLNDLTEEQAMSVVECAPTPLGNAFIGAEIDGILMYSRALTALDSLLQSKGVITVNPYGSEPPHNYGLLHLYPTGDELMDLSFQDALRWQTAQSQLWENVLILVKDEK
jgi:hypothetical protein